MGSHEERIIRILTDRANRAVLDVLNDAARELSVREIAQRLVARDVSIARSSEYEADLERTLLSLHHECLPRLDEVGLVEYDHEENTVAYGNYAAVDAEWREVEIFDELLSRFRTVTEPDEDAIGIVEGREDATRYSRQLADRADSELFIIYTGDDLLEEGCLPHAEGAIERGVQLYAGGKNRPGREFFREHLPEATIWEPQLDWMNEPSSYPKVSRLIFGDREEVLVGLWGESAADGSKTELAMVGEGANNPLVVLVRELLGPRLDHLDYQSEEFLGDLPFET